MKALILTEHLDDPCYRYRIEAFLPALAQEGFEVETVRLDRSVTTRTRQLLGAGRADVVILQRKLMPMIQVGLLRLMARRLVYDLDDALFHRDGNHRKGPHSWKRTTGFWATMHAADLAIVGNDYLKQCASVHLDPERIHVVPTCVEPGRYPMARHEAVGPRAALAWVGQTVTLKQMAQVAECLAAVGRKLPGMKLRLICDTRTELPGVQVELCPWSTATEAADLAAADIGISWLPKNPFNRGKCGLKILQYMAAGLPVVANPVGVTPQLVAHGRTGFLASTPEEWAESIARLANDPDLRRRMGAEGRRVVEERYSVQHWGPRFASLIRGTALDATSAYHVLSTRVKTVARSTQPAENRVVRQASSPALVGSDKDGRMVRADR